MKIRILIFSMCIILISVFPNNSMGQVEVLASPEQTIASLFKAMAEANGDLAAKVFTENASLNSVFTTPQGEQKTKEGDVVKFIEAIGTPHDEIWDERISNLEVKIDGDLAQAWMNYSFYLGEKFSHCGVNAIHLIRRDGQWKIFQIVDTRRKLDCN